MAAGQLAAWGAAPMRAGKGGAGLVAAGQRAAWGAAPKRAGKGGTGLVAAGQRAAWGAAPMRAGRVVQARRRRRRAPASTHGRAGPVLPACSPLPPLPPPHAPAPCSFVQTRRMRRRSGRRRGGRAPRRLPRGSRRRTAPHTCWMQWRTPTGSCTPLRWRPPRCGGEGRGGAGHGAGLGGAGQGHLLPLPRRQPRSNRAHQSLRCHHARSSSSSLHLPRPSASSSLPPLLPIPPLLLPLPPPPLLPLPPSSLLPPPPPSLPPFNFRRRWSG